LIDPTLADWIAAQGAFPSTMVDRIVPATKPEDIERLAAQTGVLDLSPVMHEPFRQWVVEDGFVGRARPDLGAVGVQLVSDVTPVRVDEAADAERRAFRAGLSRLSDRA
jgi:fructuronate reductase